MKNKRVTRSLFSAWSFLIFFLLTAFIVTCSMLLFLNETAVPESVIRERAGITFLNVLLLSALFTVIDALRRYFTVKRPIQAILSATQKISQGDFSARIKPPHISGNINELDIIIENFNKMAEELSGIETLRTDFIANVSHEIKTPLAIIQNYAAMLQNTGLSKETRAEYAKTLTDASGRLSGLITNILKLNKLENQQIYPNHQVFDLGEQLCERLLSFEKAWEEKKLQIETDIAPDVCIRADQELLSLVWNNLFSNAVKFADTGGKVSVSMKEDGDAVVVRVADTGCGISKEVGRHIFEKFYQGDAAHAAQGNGLGLALVKRVVDIVRGDIQVESVIGKGSVFTVRLRRYGDGEM